MSIRSNVRGTALARFQRTANAKVDRKIDDVEFLMEEIMQDAATEAKHFVSIRGVKDTVENSYGRGTGGIEERISSRVVRRGDKVEGSFGFLPNTPQKPEDSWQESGTRLFRENPDGDFPKVPGVNRGIRPMFAIRDAGEHASEHLRERFGY